MDGQTLRELATNVSQYFLDFLESDFKKQQAPRRRLILQTDSGFRAGMKVVQYPTLHAAIWKALNAPVSSQIGIEVKPRQHTRPITATLHRIIAEQISAIKEASVESVRRAVVEQATNTYPRAKDNPEAWVDGVRGQLATELGTEIIRPLLGYLDGPLSQQAYSVSDSIFSAEGELISRVGADLDAILPEVLSKFLASPNADGLSDALAPFLTLEGVKAGLTEFFENFVSADAFLEFRDIETYATTGEGLQLYLYVGSLKYKSVVYPLFFFPIRVERDSKTTAYTIQIVNHLYTNRRAIDFALQELAEQNGRIWKNPIRDRITYFAQEQSIYEIAASLFRNIAAACDLPGQIELSSTAADASNAHIGLSSSLYLAAFERADEALLNDYEEIITQAKSGGSAIVDLFEGMVRSVVLENPKPIAREVNGEWDALPIIDRVVIDAPIPLNEEQLKILSAIRNPNGRLIVVEGPPGTGKSHTITAIAADCALNKRSCLILSDKSEALEVVHNKLSDAMNRVRHDKDFPNPVLRLGQQNANFKRLTSTNTVTQISAYARATRDHQPRLQNEHRQTKKDLQDSLNRKLSHLGSVSLVDLKTLHEIEHKVGLLSASLLKSLQECHQPKLDALDELKFLEENQDPIEAYFTQVFAEGDYTPSTLWRKVRLDQVVKGYRHHEDTAVIRLFEKLESENLKIIKAALLEYDQLRMPLFGYLFRGVAVRQIESRLNELATSRPLILRNDRNSLWMLLEASKRLKHALAIEGLKADQDFSDSYSLISAEAYPHEGVDSAYKAVDVIKRIDPAVLDALLECPVDDPQLWPLAIKFLHIWLRTRTAFSNSPDIDYIGTKTHLERLNTSAMNCEVDARLVDFMDNHRTDAKTLAKVIANQEKFPEQKFKDIKESFPVIIASIREFGEFMPLAPNLFDVVVIDEASQVSVAQALPALLRARKVVVLGDSRQFSNVKSANASIATNDKYRADLREFFERKVSREVDALQRLAIFDVKRSILEFCSLGASYSTMLVKHFRSYQELIGYSSETFYKGQLQALKIRGVPIEDVIRFDLVSVGDRKVTRATNEAEVDYILERLLELLEEEEPPTVGVITPFREQQTLLTKRLFGHASGRDFEAKLRLKIMTFDSCQGEERNIIFYSTVATPGMDALNYIFPVDLKNADAAVEEKLKVQRLNVGFSRAQEMIWFVHSMPLDQFRGAFGQALAYYANALKRSDARPEQTDQSSPMERKVLDWLQKAPFVRANIDNIEIMPQFPIGNYLRQLDPTYSHPAWRVDFLLTVQTEKSFMNIVVEYDGFEHHFVQGRDVNVGNHERYLLPADLERQLTLESYGYRFLRINRFNLGRDPVATISERLAKLVAREDGEMKSAAVEGLQRQAEGMAAGNLKPCSRCNRVQPLEAFFDQSLRGGDGGTGRVCTSCKSADARTTSTSASSKGERRRRRRRWR